MIFLLTVLYVSVYGAKVFSDYGDQGWVGFECKPGIFDEGRYKVQNGYYKHNEESCQNIAKLKMGSYVFGKGPQGGNGLCYIYYGRIPKTWGSPTISTGYWKSCRGIFKACPTCGEAESIGAAESIAATESTPQRLGFLTEATYVFAAVGLSVVLYGSFKYYTTKE